MDRKLARLKGMNDMIGDVCNQISKKVMLIWCTVSHDDPTTVSKLTVAKDMPHHKIISY